MFDWKDYLLLKTGKLYVSDKTGKLTLALDFTEDNKKIEHDIKELKQSLMNVAKCFHKKLIFVVDEDKVEMFE